MQDNELDDLFCSRLGSLEMEPSANVWANINAQLGGSKKKSLVPVWSMAASVLIVLGIGTWFMVDKPAVTQPTQLTRTKTQPTSQMVKPLAPTTVQQAIVETETARGSTSNAWPVSRIARMKTTNKHVSPITNQETETVVVTKEATPEQPALVLAAVPERAVLRPVVPEMQLSMPAIAEDAANIKPVTPVTPVIAAVQPQKKAKKQGIHSLGGLINVVIAKVDKREDKLIEFTESDDDQANITGINLGILKVKKDK